MAKLLELVVRSIGVVDKAANRKTFMLKSEQPDVNGLYEVSLWVDKFKVDTAKGIAYGIVYESGIVDSQGDWADEASIEAAAHNFLEQGRQREIDINHDGRLGKGVVIESSMLKSSHPNYPPIEGPAWGMAIKLGEEALLRSKDGELTGFSLEGRAKLDFNAAPPTGKSAAKVKPLAKFNRNQNAKITTIPQ